MKTRNGSRNVNQNESVISNNQEQDNNRNVNQNENVTSNNQQQDNKIWFISIIVLTIALGTILIYTFKYPPRCNLNNVPNRDFNVYYGILEDKNPFGKLSAENNKNVPLFKPIITESMKAPSMILKGKYGAGKTHIREYRLSEVDKETIVVKIYGNNPSLNSYFEDFVKNFPNLKIEHNRIFAEKFNSTDFMHLLMTELVNIIISMNWENENLSSKAEGIPDRFKVACILAFYSKIDLQDILLKLLNDVFYEKTHGLFCKSLLMKNLVSIEQQYYNKVSKRYEDNLDLVQSRKLLDSVRIFNEKKKEENALFLYRIGEFFTISPSVYLQDPIFVDLSVLMKFIKTILNRRILFVIDSLDENEFFFDKKNSGKPHLNALQTFIDSAVTSEVLSLALGNKNDAIFNILIFIPSVGDLQIKNWKRIDKIPVIDLEWNYLMLYNYADFVLDYLASQWSPRCKSAPSFGKLLNGTDIAIGVTKELRNPRDLHIFMGNLIKVMNQNVMFRSEPFIASKRDVEEAMIGAKKEMTQL